ncbi:MAG: sensor histidine kinase [Dermatophilaceae bacterium]
MPLLAHRRHPYAVAAVTVASLVLVASIDRVPGIGAVGPYVALHLAARTTPDPGGPVDRFLRSRWWRRLVVAGIVVLLAWFGLVGAPWIGLAVAVWWLGRASVDRSAVTGPRPLDPATLQEAVLDERARVAQDLHDTVAHHVSVLAMQAGIARRAVPAGAPETNHLLQAIETTSHLAMRDLRRALGILTDPGDDGQPWPRTLMVELRDLVERLSGVGLPVTLTERGRPQPLTAEVTAAATLIVQEALTNVITHAGTVSTQLDIDWAADLVQVRVINQTTPRHHPHPSHGTGRGLHNMRHRAEAVGGTVTVGARAGGRFVVEAVMPVAQR